MVVFSLLQLRCPRGSTLFLAGVILSDSDGGDFSGRCSAAGFLEREKIVDLSWMKMLVMRERRREVQVE